MFMKRFNDFKLYFGYTLQFHVFQVFFKYITIIISQQISVINTLIYHVTKQHVNI